jgi:hypothetical protein
MLIALHSRNLRYQQRLTLTRIKVVPLPLTAPVTNALPLATRTMYRPSMFEMNTNLSLLFIKLHSLYEPRRSDT